MLNIKDVKAGDTIILTDDLDCLDAGPIKIIDIDDGDLGFECSMGWHMLDAHGDDNGNLFNMSKTD